jgi:hypothetical protein
MVFLGFPTGGGPGVKPLALMIERKIQAPEESFQKLRFCRLSPMRSFYNIYLRVLDMRCESLVLQAC